MGVVSLMEGEWSCYRGGHKWRENGHVKEVVTNGGRMAILYRGGQFSGLRIVMLQRWSI